MTYDRVIDHIQGLFGTKDFIPLHRPLFEGREKDYVCDAIDSSFVSTAGEFVSEFEEEIAALIGTDFAIAAVNGTAALHISLILSGAESGDEVVTQPLTFVATCNAMSYIGLNPVFVDVDRQTLGMSPQSLQQWLDENAERRDAGTFNRNTGRRIRAVVPMHTFGHPCRIDEIASICKDWNVKLIEDAAESLGSLANGKMAGSIGDFSILSFNGNKILTTGGGGMICTNDEAAAKRATHLTTTAKVPHSWDYIHDEVGYNYRMPNLNAALGRAQLEQLDGFLTSKRQLAAEYRDFFTSRSEVFVDEPAGAKSNFWLNAIIMENQAERDAFLKATNKAGVMTRPVWCPMHRLPMFSDAERGPLENTEWLAERLVNLPSSARKVAQ